MDSVSTVIVVCAASAIAAILLYVFSRPRSNKIKLNQEQIHARVAAQLREEAEQNGEQVSDKEFVPVRVTWLDGPHGRQVRRYGTTVRQRGKRTFILPTGTVSKRDVVRRRSDHVLDLSAYQSFQAEQLKELSKSYGLKELLT